MTTKYEAWQYRKVPVQELLHATEQFLRRHGDDSNGIIADNEFDMLFDSVASELQKAGAFSEDGIGDEADFRCYRYVDQVSVIDVILNHRFPIPTLIGLGQTILEKAHRPLCIIFHWKGDYIAAFHGGSVMGTVNE